MSNQQLQNVRMILSFVQPSFGALVLFYFYLWLRSRETYDRSLVFLAFTLLSSAIPAGIHLISGQGEYQWIITAVCSPTSSILMTVTAFQLLRVKEAILRNRLELWSKIVCWFVTVGSLSTLILTLTGERLGIERTVGLNIDAAISLIALSTMGVCLSYSFYKYGTQPLIVLTLADFTYIVSYQFVVAARGGNLVESPVLIALNITSVSIMTLLFIALTLAWGLSRSSLLRFKESESVQALVMFIDLRGFTQWAKKVGDGKYVVNFMNAYTEWIVNSASKEPYGSPNVVKRIGDGLMIVWEVNDHMIARANAVVGLAYAILTGYQPWLANLEEFYKGGPKSLGIGIDFGQADRLTSENGTYDYLGLAANYAAKMQSLARPFGGIVVQSNWRLSDELSDKLPKRGKFLIGDECISVRATNDVKLLSSENGSSVH